MTRNKTPCYNCAERRLGCSAECEKYKAMQEDRKKRNDYLRMSEADRYTSDYIARRIYKRK